MKLNHEQEQSVSARGRELLVSAAAGSGKTTVLVERIVDRITAVEDPLDVDRLLVVTFTKDAAAQMRSKLARRLEKLIAARPDDENLVRQLTLLPVSTISTVHSFCESLLRRYFHVTGRDPGFSVMDEDEAELMRAEAMDRLFQGLYEEYEEGAAGAPPGFADFISRYATAKQDQRPRDMVLGLYDKSRNHPDPDAWLDHVLELYDGAAWQGMIEQHAWGRTLLEQALIGLDRARLRVRQARRVCEPRAAELAKQIELCGKDLDALDRIMAVLESHAPLRETAVKVRALADLDANARILKLDDEPKARKSFSNDLRKKAMEEIAAAVRIVELLADPGAERVFFESAPTVETLVRLVRLFHAEYDAAKNAAAVLDFGDLEQDACRILLGPGGEPAPAAEELRDWYREIMIDEYQDINPVQEAILTAAARPGVESLENLFMVGDVKQSIYRFRLADPGIFTRKYNEYKGNKEDTARGRLISLPRNYRSRPPVIDGVNFVFRQLMRGAGWGVEYDEAAELAAGAEFPDGRSAPVELIVLALPAALAVGRSEDEAEDEAETLTRDQREAALIGNRINAMVGAGIEVTDPETGRPRPMRYSDVAVLSRTWGPVPILEDALVRAGVPVAAGGRGGFFEQTEITDMVCLFQVLDNPRQDIPLAAALRSPPLGGLTEPELVRLRLTAVKSDLYEAALAYCGSHRDRLARRVEAFFETLDRWRTMARRRPLGELVAAVYRETGYLKFAASLPAGEQRAANLDGFQAHARRFDSFARRGLARFLDFIQAVRERDRDMALPQVPVPDQDAVRLLTMHGSKGLEFPVVFLVNLGRRFNRGAKNKALVLTHTELGVGLQMIDPGQGRRWVTPALDAIRFETGIEELAEELRLLYVAMTRARERLIMVGSEPAVGDAYKTARLAVFESDWPLPAPLTLEASSCLDWLLGALVRHPAAGGLRQGIGADRVSWSGAADRSEWEISFVAADSPELQPAVGEDGAAELDLKRVLALKPLKGADSRSGEALEALAGRLNWAYGYAGAASAPAKLSVSEIKRRADMLLGGEDAPADWLAGRFRRPGFLEPSAAGLSAAERGLAVHRVLQRLALDSELSEPGVAAQVREMVEAGLLTESESLAVDPGAVAWVFESEAGRLMRADPGRALREVPFSILLPAAEVLPDLAPGLGAGERILVQGIVDALVDCGDHLALIDYKTDAVEADRVRARAEGYSLQLEFYGRAVERVWGKPVKSSFLVFLTPRVCLEWGVAGEKKKISARSGENKQKRR